MSAHPAFLLCFWILAGSAPPGNLFELGAIISFLVGTSIGAAAGLWAGRQLAAAETAYSAAHPIRAIAGWNGGPRKART